MLNPLALFVIMFCAFNIYLFCYALANTFNNYMIFHIHETKIEGTRVTNNTKIMDLSNNIRKTLPKNNDDQLDSNDEWVDTDINPHDDSTINMTNRHKEPVDYDHEYRDKDQDGYNEE